MKELNQNEIQCVAGGCGPGMFDGLLEGLAIMAGIGLTAAFGIGALVGAVAVNVANTQPDPEPYQSRR